jgi:uncharacterized protein (UPF0262 family)
MKVKELVSKLKELDQEHEVVIFNIVEEAYFEDVETVETSHDTFSDEPVVIIGFRNS